MIQKQKLEASEEILQKRRRKIEELYAEQEDVQSGLLAAYGAALERGQKNEFYKPLEFLYEDINGCVMNIRTQMKECADQVEQEWRQLKDYQQDMEEEYRHRLYTEE